MNQNHNSRNMISIILMAVGVLFILVAGSIFVTTAWKYLPEVGKQAILLGVAASLFAGSVSVSRYTNLKKTEKALFYLGTAFIGFFILSIMGGIGHGTIRSLSQIQADALKMMVAGIGMAIPVLIRFLRGKKGFDFSCLVLIMDGILICGCIAMNARGDEFTLCLAGYLMLLAMADYVKRTKRGESGKPAAGGSDGAGLTQTEADGLEPDGLDFSISIAYLIHAVFYVLLAGIFIVCADDFKSVLYPVIFVMAMVAATGITYRGRQQMIVFRVLNSLAINWFIYVLFDAMNQMLSWSDRNGTVFLAAFSVNLLIMVYSLRKEMIVVQFAFGLLVPFVQFFQYYFKALHWSLFRGAYIDASAKMIYDPFSFMMMAALLLLLFRGMKEKRITWENEGKKLAVLAGFQALIGIALFMASKDALTLEMVYHLLIAVTFLMIGICMKGKTSRAVFYTAALLAGEMAAFSQPWLQMPNRYEVEWNCLLLAVGIALLRFIWYHKKKEAALVQFILVCCLSAFLLIKDITSGSTGLGNILILGGAGLIMLLVAAICNRREYVIASSATLLLLVLYLTRTFWLSIAWWVYLFAAGVALVVLAVKKEREL